MERVFAIPEGEARLGSTPENDMALCAPGVSRHHALVRPVPGGVEIMDLGSKNGLLSKESGSRVPSCGTVRRPWISGAPGSTMPASLFKGGQT
jgi:hypothetical protein